MAKSIFPLSWESTGDQWWFATPIDWAAANGLIDLVKQLLRSDPNLLIKLTSLARIRRLETVWDDVLEPGYNVAQCRSRVASSLLLDCEPKSCNADQNTLIRAGYGGWLLYTATSAGDVAFVKDLLERDPLAVFGEGEYGITDILYGAARGGNSEVFRMVIEYAMNVNKGNSDADGNFREEIMSRAVHACARGGDLEILKDVLLDCSDVSRYRDGQGYTVLHSAAGKGRVEVVNHLIKTYDIVDKTDNQGNTALHVAAYKGCSSVVETLAVASPVLATLTNSNGNTFLHMAVNGFQSRGFHRIDQQMELMKKLVSNKIINLENIINITNNEGKTALHIAVSENIQCEVLELLMTVPSADLNICDIDGYTAVGLLKQCRKTANFRQQTIQGIGTSPGTSFRLPDPDLLSFTGDGNESDVSCGPPSSRFSSCSSELTTTRFDASSRIDISTSNKNSVYTSSPSKTSKSVFAIFDRRKSRQQDDKPISLRQKFSKKGVFPSPSSREKFAASLMHGVIQAKVSKSGYSSTPFSPSTASTPYLESPVSSPIVEGGAVRRSKFFSGPLAGERSDGNHRRVSSFSKSLMNQYFCFGAHGLAFQVEDSVSCKGPNRTCSRRLVF